MNAVRGGRRRCIISMYILLSTVGVCEEGMEERGKGGMSGRLMCRVVLPNEISNHHHSRTWHFGCWGVSSIAFSAEKD